MKAMQCDRTAELIGAYLDQELDADARQEVAAHLGSCGECTALADDLRRLGRQIAAIGREPAPRHLAAQVRDRLALEATPAPARLAVLARLSAGNRLRLAAAAVVLALLTASITTLVVSHMAAEARTEQEIAAAHVRSLLQDSPTQIASSETHTVKPWFTGRLEFSPVVKDLAAEGFPLAGARLDFIGERRVAALVYHRRLHVVNVFMWPSAEETDRAPRALKQLGYNILVWHRAGMAYWAISDLNAGELRQLQSLL
jgi:anti-sigma factor RsiW